MVSLRFKRFLNRKRTVKKFSAPKRKIKIRGRRIIRSREPFPEVFSQSYPEIFKNRPEIFDTNRPEIFEAGQKAQADAVNDTFRSAGMFMVGANKEVDDFDDIVDMAIPKGEL